jgi:hypothetical protein
LSGNPRSAFLRGHRYDKPLAAMGAL